MPQEPQSSPHVDGITPASTVPDQQPVATPPPVDERQPKIPLTPKKKGINVPIIFLSVLAFLYAVPALAFLAMFPTPDGSMNNVKQIGTLVFAAGGLAWFVLLLFGVIRILSIKDHPRMRFFGAMRLLGFCVPMILLSALTAALINVAAQPRLQVLFPETLDALVAPVSVTFGMDTALKLFANNGLQPLKYEWDYNNDGIKDQETYDPTSTYLISKAGIYSVVVRVTMTNGQVKPVIYRLVVPKESFGLQPADAIIEEPVTFTLEHLFKGETIKLAKAKWDFDGDGTVDQETDKMVAVNTYHRLGPVNVSVTMTMANQSEAILRRTIQVVEPPKQPFPITLETEPQMLLGPPPFGVLFTLKTKEPIANATWDFGNNKSGEGLRVAQVYSAVGTYNVNVTARSQSGAIAKLSKVVRVTNPLNIPDIRFEGSPEVRNYAIEGQVPLSIELTPVTSQPLVSFSWDPGNTVEAEVTDKTLRAVYRDEGKFFIDLIGVDPDQNVYRKRISITATPPQSLVSFSMDPSTPTAPANITFDASDTFIPSNEDITGFVWDFGDSQDPGGNRFTGARIEHRFEKPGTYTITLTVRTNADRVYTAKQTLLVRAALVDACFIPSRTNGKAPLGVRFDASCSTGEFESWKWDFGDGSFSDMQSPTHVFLSAGEYLVNLEAVAKGGLKTTQSATISVSQ